MILRHAFDDGEDTSSTSSVVPSVRNGVWYRDDFLSQSQSTWTVVGGGTGQLIGLAGRPGIALQTVSAAGVDGHRVALSTASTAPILVGGGVIAFDCSLMIPVLSDGVNNIVLRAGLGDTAGLTDNVDGLYLEYDFATHGDHAWRLCAAANSARTKVTSGISPVAGSWHRLHVELDAAAAVLSCSIDGVAGSNTVGSNIPTGAARYTQCAMLQAVKQLGAGALTVQHDYYEFMQTFTVAR